MNYDSPGAQVGNVISMALTGIILRHLCWRSVFYIYGALGLVWYLLWFIFVSDSPANHPFISEKEKKYLADAVVDVTDERYVSNFSRIKYLLL